MGKRAYLPQLGRFTSLDPVYGGGVNAYNYANNDPINNNDPNGTLSLSLKIEVGGASATVVLVGTIFFLGQLSDEALASLGFPAAPVVPEVVNINPIIDLHQPLDSIPEGIEEASDIGAESSVEVGDVILEVAIEIAL